MKFPSVTIHVTVKNAKNTIKQCIDSLLRLNYPNYKIHVTDAFSTDGTCEILKKYGKKIKLGRVSGVAPRAHNHVLQKVDTEFYAMTDADCVVDKNWLKNLISAFESKEIVAVGGIVKTPKNVNKLQKLIGRELEDRFNRFSKTVSRFPTMNMAVRSSVAKKVKMSEQLKVAFETDWGFKLEKYGKLVYVPDAIVWHYHRGSWLSFFKQQMNYTRFFPQVYEKHSGKMKGDYISTGSMFLQEFLFSISILIYILSFFWTFLLNYFFISLLLLFLAYILNIQRLTKNSSDMILFVLLFLVRNFAWTTGFVIGVIEFLLARSKKS